MKRLTEKIRLRLSPEELDYLMRCMEKENASKPWGGRKNLSAFVREKLLTNIGYRNKRLQEQNDSLSYELRKIGVNLNQIARKMNAGFGRPQDVTDLLSYLDSIEQLLQTYIEKTESLWQPDKEGKPQ